MGTYSLKTNIKKPSSQYEASMQEGLVSTAYSYIIPTVSFKSKNELKSFESIIDDLDNYWKGNFATGFINDTTKFTGKARQIHNAMKDVPVMLKDIIVTKDAA